MYQPSYYQIRIKVTLCQKDSIMTLNCELCQSSQSYLAGLYQKIVKNLFPLHIYVDQMIIQQRFNVLLQVQFYNVFTNVLSKVFTGILKIYELPKIYNKNPKYCQTLTLTIIIYQANSMSQLQRAFQIYPYKLY